MKLHLPKMLFTAVVMACSMAQGGLESSTLQSVTVGEQTFPVTEEDSVQLLVIDNNGTAFAPAEGVDYTADYTVLESVECNKPDNSTQGFYSRLTVTSATTNLAELGTLIVANGTKVTETGETVEYTSAALAFDEYGTYSNDIIAGNTGYGSDGGITFWYDTNGGRSGKIVLTGSINLVDDAYFTIDAGSGANGTYFEGALSGIDKTLTLLKSKNLYLSGGATVKTLSSVANVFLDDKKSDGTTAAAVKSYTFNNLTGTGSMTVDSGVTLNLLGDTTADGSTVLSSLNITLNGGTLLLGDYTDTARYISLTGDVTKGSNTSPDVLIGKKGTITVKDGGSIVANKIKFGVKQTENNFVSSATLVVESGGRVEASQADLENGTGETASGSMSFKNGSTASFGNIYMNKDSRVYVEKGANLTLSESGVVLTGADAGKAAVLSTNTGAKFSVGSNGHSLSDAYVKVTGNAGTTVALALSGTYSLENAHTGKVTEKNAANTTYDAIKATAGDMTFLNKANGLSVNALTLSAGKTVAAYVGDSESTALTSITVNTSLTIEGDATIAASALTLGDNTTLDFSGSVTLNGTLTLGSDMVLSDGMIARLSNGGGITLFTGLSGITNVSGELDVLASEWFSNDEFAENGTLGHMHLCYAGGKLQLIPEPTTATLSLLALCGLAARRRRAAR